MKKSSTRKTRGVGREQVFPVRSARKVTPVFFTGALLFLMLLVYLGVLKVHYGKQIQQLKLQTSELSSELRNLQSHHTSLTSLAQIQSAAQEMGMHSATRSPEVLAVSLPGDDLEDHWLQRLGATRQRVATAANPPHLAMLGATFGGER